MLAETFVTFSASHLAAMILTGFVAVGLALLGRALSPRRRRDLGWLLAGLLVANELIYYGWTLSVYGPAEFVARYLPLHLCGAAVFVLAYAVMRRNWLGFEIAYFWGLGGTAQALLTPNLQAAFPHYHFVQYFLTHGGILVVVVYLIVAWGMHPRKAAVLRTFLITNAYMAAVAVVNVVLRLGGLDANYMFLCRRPEGQSPFFFLPWPWYILFLEGVALVVVTALYLPWVPTVRRSASPRPARGEAAGGD
jgi:hypothetical integral membrane protein (TIGR02206 family)